MMINSNRHFLKIRIHHNRQTLSFSLELRKHLERKLFLKKSEKDYQHFGLRTAEYNKGYKCVNFWGCL